MLTARSPSMVAFSAAEAAALKRVCPQSRPDVGTQDTEVVFPSPNYNLSEKSGIFSLLFESGFGYVTHAGLELTSILLPQPLE